MIECDFCNSSVSKSNYSKHRKTDLCKNINSIIEKYKNENISKIKILNEEVEKYKKNIDILNNKCLLLETQIKDASEKSDEYKKIIEKVTFCNKITKDFKHNTFEIGININDKQLNRTKYKDIPENEVKKEIQSLKLKNNYQLEYREDDGYINITNLCKAGGKLFADWSRLKRTECFKQVLSSDMGIPISDLIKVGSGSKCDTSQTWSHPQIAINIAQWISPEFDVLVSKWVYQIMLTGKFDIRDNKTTKQLDEMNKENKLLKNRIKLLESKTLQKQKREVFENDKNVVYIVTTEYKEAQGHYKIGKTKDLQNRLSTLNTSDKHEVIYYVSCKHKKAMDLLEQLVHMKLEDKRIEPNKEWFLSEEEAEDFIKIIDECKNVNKL